MLKNKRRNRGFTLVELSIVLVIIGLIIGGVLTGRQIMQNAQITNAVNAIQAYEAQFQTYVQNYGTMAGDDASAVTRFANTTVANVGNGNGNGTLDGAFDASATPAASETQFVWGDLRAAGLVKNQTSGIQPPNPFGGIYGFQNGAFTTISSNVLCLTNVPGDAAEAIDSRLDDGGSNSGSIQAIEEVLTSGTASKAGTQAPATTYVSGSTYTMCVRM